MLPQKKSFVCFASRISDHSWQYLQLTSLVTFSGSWMRSIFS